MDCSVLPLSAARALWPAFARLQDIWSPDQYAALLARFAGLGARVVVARMSGRVVGSLMFLPALDLARVADVPGLPAAIRAAGIEPAALLIRCNIFVAPDHRRRGVSVALERACGSASRAAGFTHSLGIFYETREILSWAERRPDKIAAGITDAAGDPVYFFPLG